MGKPAARGTIMQVPDDGAAFLKGLVRESCLDGNCYELAVVLHRGTGLPLVGLWSPTASGDDGIPGTWRHAAVRWGDGFQDARGFVSAEKFGSPFGEPRPWDVRDISEADLLAVRPVSEASFGTLSRVAQAAWPELPWLPGSFHARMAAFVADLEALSRRHGVWIRAPYPAARPVLAEGDGDEKGYGPALTGDGLAVTIDRSFR